MSKHLPPATADKLAKLVPRLASTHEGEVVATVAAIGRTLAGAGLDWHDLAARLAGPSQPPVAAPDWRGAAPRHDAAWDAAMRKHREATARRAAKPRPEPKPYPTFGKLSHFARVERLEAVGKLASLLLMMGDEKRAAFEALKAKITQRPHELLTGKEIALFNACSASLWAAEQGRSQAA